MKSNKDPQYTGRKSFTQSLKLPLSFCVTIAIFVGVVVLFGSSGGTQGSYDWRLAFAAAGIAFVVSIVICSTLMMTYKPNDSYIGNPDDGSVNNKTDEREAYTSQKRKEEISKKKQQSQQTSKNMATRHENSDRD